MTKFLDFGLGKIRKLSLFFFLSIIFIFWFQSACSPERNFKNEKNQGELDPSRSIQFVHLLPSVHSKLKRSWFFQVVAAPTEPMPSFEEIEKERQQQEQFGKEVLQQIQAFGEAANDEFDVQWARSTLNGENKVSLLRNDQICTRH